MSANWFLKPESLFHQWSCGQVRSISDLYSQNIFGPKSDFCCQCGKYAGEGVETIICDRCGVKICADSKAERMRRMGHIELAILCRHPMDSEMRISEDSVLALLFRAIVTCDKHLDVFARCAGLTLEVNAEL